MWLRVASLVLPVLLVLSHAPASAKTGGRAGGGSWSKPSSSSRSSSSSRPSSSSSSRSSSSSSSYRPSTSTYRPSTTTSTRTYYTSSPSSSSSSTYHPVTSTDSSYTPSSGTTYTSYDSGPRSSGGGGSWFGLLFIGGILAALVLGAVALARRRGGDVDYSPSYATGDLDSVDVSVLRVAIDGRARRFVQNELSRIAKLADTATEEGRLLLLREVSMMLRRVRDAWVYGGAVNEPMRGIEAAKACFDGHVDNARMKINLETVSNVDGVVQIQSAPNFTPRSEQGEGVILVSIIVAARTELFTVAHIGDGETLRKAIENAPHRTASDLVAVEIVWMPSEDNDRMSSVELEAKYPHPELIPLTGALVGKTFCAYCSGPFPAELVSCPHCGAPAPGHEALPRAA